MKRSVRGLILLCMGIMALAACSGPQTRVTVGPAQGEVALQVKASSFRFEPNRIEAVRGAVVVLQVENISDAGHNFTIKDPQGKVLQSVNLPSKGTVPVAVSLAETGTYEFYCDKPLHSGFGMKGQIIVSPGP